MSDHAVLIFVQGCQRGQKLNLPSGGQVVLGRSAAAGVVLSEQYVSREHARLTLTSSGWLLQNLSSNGTEINGKRYKSEKKQVLLDTGDIIGAGRETQILFVSAGDDADEALASYEAKHPTPASSPAVPEQAVVPASAANAEQKPPAVEAAPSPAPAVPQATAPVTGMVKRKSKLARYAPYLGIYAAALVALVIVLEKATNAPQESVSAASSRLSEGDIRTILTSPLQAGANDVRAAEELSQAKAIFKNRHFHQGDVYRCVKHYRLHLAYKTKSGFDNVSDDQDFLRATNELVADVLAAYENGWKKEQGRDWAGARQEYERLLTMVPEDDTADRVHQQLILNVRGHLAFVRLHMGKKR